MFEELKPSQDRLCLKMIAPLTLDVTRDLGTTTCEDIATMIINKFMQTNPRLTGQETIRRRVYDAINVLSAAGVIQKSGKQVSSLPTRVPLRAPPSEPTSHIRDERVRAKEQLLCDKVRLLILYKVLITRNFVRDPSPNPIPMPVILLGIGNPGHASFTQSLNRRELEIRSSRNMTFMAPSDIMQRIGLSRETIERFLALSPDFTRFGHLLLRDPEEEAE
jgi:hypothetical protein